ncbi:MAG: redoxin domain-containing protein, partial [Phycisphaerales bacterium]
VVPRQPPSLVGKKLPELQDISVVLKSEQNKNKKILVCFWDMHQRPSRHCVVELAGRAEQLAQKGVTVVAIQALKMDEEALDKWVRENGVPFSVGIIRGDHEKTRTAWGVKSFPWLILTDKNHVVRREGFTLSDLDGMLEAGD